MSNETRPPHPLLVVIGKIIFYRVTSSRKDKLWNSKKSKNILRLISLYKIIMARPHYYYDTRARW